MPEIFFAGVFGIGWEKVILGNLFFAYDEEERIFHDVFKLAREKLGDTAFLRYRGFQ